MRAEFDKPHVKATVFRAASIERLEDAKCLHTAGRFQGAIYLCGYVLECELKYCVCVRQRIRRMEVSKARGYRHGLAELLDAAGMANSLYEKDDRRVAFQNIISRWSTDIRYSGRLSSEKESEEFLKDTRFLWQWLETESRP